MLRMVFEKEGGEGGLLFEDRGEVCDFLFCEVRVKVSLHTWNTNPANAQLTSVPAWRNSLQGNCNSKTVPSQFTMDEIHSPNEIPEFLGGLQTNVAYYEGSARDDNVNNFVSGTPPAGNVNPWVTTGRTFNGVPPQKNALDPNQMLQAAGISNTVNHQFLMMVVMMADVAAQLYSGTPEPMEDICTGEVSPSVSRHPTHSLTVRPGFPVPALLSPGP